MQVIHTNDISKKNKYKEYVSQAQASTSVNMHTNERKIERKRQNVYELYLSRCTSINSLSTRHYASFVRFFDNDYGRLILII